MAAEGRASRKACSNWSGRFFRCFAGAGPGPNISSSSSCPTPGVVAAPSPSSRLLSCAPPSSTVALVMVDTAVVSLSDAIASGGGGVSSSARVLGILGEARDRASLTNGGRSDS